MFSMSNSLFNIWPQFNKKWRLIGMLSSPISFNLRVYQKLIAEYQGMTIKKAKGFLVDYHMWHIEANHFNNWIKYPKNFGEKPRQFNESDAENKLADQARAQFECELRIKTLEHLASIDSQSALFADLLTFRWINNWTVKKTCTELAEKHHRDFISERTYANYLKKALYSHLPLLVPLI